MPNIVLDARESFVDKDRCGACILEEGCIARWEDFNVLQSEFVYTTLFYVLVFQH